MYIYILGYTYSIKLFRTLCTFTQHFRLYIFNQTFCVLLVYHSQDNTQIGHRDNPWLFKWTAAHDERRLSLLITYRRKGIKSSTYRLSNTKVYTFKAGLSLLCSCSSPLSDSNSQPFFCLHTPALILISHSQPCLCFHTPALIMISHSSPHFDFTLPALFMLSHSCPLPCATQAFLHSSPADCVPNVER